MKRFEIIGCALALAGATALQAAHAQGGDAATQAALRQEMRDVLSRLVASGALDPTASGAALEVEAPPDQILTLGLVLDAAPGRGPRVLAVTPGGNGEALGLRTGDRLLAVNGQSLAGSGAEAVRTQVLRAGGATRFELERDGRTVSVEGRVRPVQVPGFRLTVGGGTGVTGNASRALAAATPAAGEVHTGGCGYISHFATAPRSEKLYPSKIIAIDGHIPGPSSSSTFRVAVGRHEVTLAENIDYQQLPMVYSRGRRMNSEKTFAVDVAPDTTVLVAARLVPDGARGSADYWQPVAWKEVPERCR